MLASGHAALQCKQLCVRIVTHLYCCCSTACLLLLRLQVGAEHKLIVFLGRITHQKGCGECRAPLSCGAWS